MGVIAVLLFLCSLTLAQATLDFSKWDALLKRCTYIDNSGDLATRKFNYTALVDTNYQSLLQQVELELADANVTGFTYNQHLAFWINVYNFMVVKIVYENPCAHDAFGACRPIHSLVEVGSQQPSSVTHAVWGLRVLSVKSVKEGAGLSLNDVMHILTQPYQEKKFDPRIYSCLSCSTLTCPDVKDYAYTEEHIEEQLTESAKEWLSNTNKGIQIVAEEALLISPLFNTYRHHFSNTSYSSCKTYNAEVVGFLAKYGPPDVQTLISQYPCPYLYYFPYDRSLNGPIAQICTADRLCCPLWALLTLGVGVILVTIVVIFMVRKKKSKKQGRRIERHSLIN